MSMRRLVATTTAMGLLALVLRAVTPDLSWVTTAAATGPWRAADVVGPDHLLLSVVAGLAWTAWAWGALGLALTALSALPGVLGGVARGLTRVVLPAGARRAATLALGVGLLAGGPVLAGCGPATGTGPAPRAVAAVPAVATTAGSPAPATAEAPAPAVPTTGPVPDWPGAGPPAAGPAPPATPPVPATEAPGPPGPVRGEHVVLRGDCLWDIAAADLLARSGRTPGAAEVAAAVHAWWRLNAAVIGPDPDLLLPGQVLHRPGNPEPPRPEDGR
ncbi:hypothetical protein [Geodermatophilus marinus]|uniref:hypothetical protein n=1 Tax=Geodermatophilus sp. LHW52908 TaxID=2303986 RepID=UPI000E3E029F|nr:hypothetical protein [Geodermatophilus sp. LHW52908]RFU21795.1 hypothetical protein D0Z06_09140 [Geodermatophilus sp. LHW52908]